MKVIIIGADEVGRSIARHLLKEDHSVVLIDKDENLLSIAADSLDVQTLQGLGSRPSVLELAGAKDADILIAVTRFDEINMVACQMAYSLYDIPKKIARVRDASYLALTGSHVYTPDNMPVDVVVSPELEVAQAILRAMFVPGSFDAYGFDEGHVQLVGTHVMRGSPLLNKKLEEWDYKQVPLKILALFRKERLVIPTRYDHLEEGDEVFFLARQADVADCMSMLGREEQPVRRAFVIGGGHVGFHICEALERLRISTRVLEQSEERADFLAETLNKCTVLHGDALNRNILEQENIGEMDMVLSVTSNDSANVLSSILVRQLGAKNVMTLVNKDSMLPIATDVGLEKVISPQQITVSRILQQMRQGTIREIHTVRDGEAEVLEIEIKQDSPLLGTQITDIHLPNNCQFGVLIKADGRILMEEENETLQTGDRAVIFVMNDSIPIVEKLF